MPETQTTNLPSFESVWAALQETDRIIKEIGKKQEEYTENLKEIERIRKEDAQLQKEKNDEFYEKLGHLTTLFGEMTEAMVAPRICEKFEEFGLYFPKANPNSRLNDRVNKISFEVDIMLENGEKAMLMK